MKADIQKSVTEIIDKSSVEIDTGERQNIIDEAIQTALGMRSGTIRRSIVDASLRFTAMRKRQTVAYATHV